MKTGKLSKSTGFWQSLFFMGDVCKMRKKIMSYLKGEGLKCSVSDGAVVFEFNNLLFTTNFNITNGIGECTIAFEEDDEDYEALDLEQKTFVADKVNTDLDNHSKVLTYNNSFKVCTSFYFTSRQMLINLFSLHFEELTESLNEAIDIIKCKIEESKSNQRKRIGFCIESSQENDTVPEEMQVAARI